MKNALLKTFLILFCLFNIFLFTEIVTLFLFLYELWGWVPYVDVWAIFLAVFWVVAIVIFFIYFRKHRIKKEIIKPVEFNTPTDMTPPEAGFLIDGMVDGEDLSSLIVYWAGKNYISITGEKKNQKLTKLVDKLPKESREYEKKLFNVIFSPEKEILVKDITDRINNNENNQKTIQKVVDEIEKEVSGKYFDKYVVKIRQIFIIVFTLLFYASAILIYVSHLLLDEIGIIVIMILATIFLACADWVLNYFDYRHKNKSKIGQIFSFICFIIFMVVAGGLCFFILWGSAYRIIFAICMLVTMFFVVFFSRKFQIYNDEGQKKLGLLLGFKEFLEVVEKDRIKMLVEENPSFFYDVLPYAYVLGVSDKWIEKLNVIKADIPELKNKNILTNAIMLSLILASSRLIFVPMIKNIRFKRGTHAMGGRGGGPRRPGGGPPHHSGGPRPPRMRR